MLLILYIGLFAYGEQYIYDSTIKQYMGTEGNLPFDWSILAKQRLDTLKERSDSPYIPDSGLKSISIEIEQLEYFIENKINPISPSAARFSVKFAEQSISMFLPLLIVILGSDIVSGEFSSGTVKILLTRSTQRWKILMSKYIAFLLMTTLIVSIMAGLSTIISGLYFNSWGFHEPIATGFRLINESFDTSHVVMITRLEYMYLIYSLTWFVSIVIFSITMMVSVLIKGTGSAIGIIIAALIGGQFLQFFLSEWQVVKYFFVSNLNLTKYLSGSYQPIENISFIFSVTVLTTWIIVTSLISFIVFTHEDVLV